MTQTFIYNNTISTDIAIHPENHDSNVRILFQFSAHCMCEIRIRVTTKKLVQATVEAVISCNLHQGVLRS